MTNSYPTFKPLQRDLGESRDDGFDELDAACSSDSDGASGSDSSNGAYTNSEISEHGYRDRDEIISVGGDAVYIINHVSDEESEGSNYTGEIEPDEEMEADERFARLLQHQEIALAQRYIGEEPDVGIFEAMAESEESLDMSYETLLEMQENLGEVKKRGLEENAINALERVQYQTGLLNRADSITCVVCMESLTTLELELIKLPCGHYFHAHCAVCWLYRRATCPICREAVQANL